MVCANCGNKQGPFYPIFRGGPRVCKNTKDAPNRMLDCVEVRKKQHAKEGHDKIDLVEGGNWNLP